MRMRDRLRGVGASLHGLVVVAIAVVTMTAPAGHSVVASAAAATGASALLWSATYAPGEGRADDVLASPDGSRVFVTGISRCIHHCKHEVLAIARAAADGHQSWAVHEPLVQGADHYVHASGLSPDGSTLFIAGSAITDSDHAEAFVVALRARDGATLWFALLSYQGQRLSIADANGLAVAPDGSAVFVTGTRYRDDEPKRLLIAAFNATTGEQLWQRASTAASVGLELTAGASLVYAVGATEPGASDIVTVALDAKSGRKVWSRRYDGAAHGPDDPFAAALSHDEGTVYVAGDSAADDEDLLALAYDADTGDERWEATYDGPKAADDEVAYSLAVSPDDSAVYAAGKTGPHGRADFLTVAIAASTGGLSWTATYRGGPRNDAVVSHGLGVSPDGTRVYVTGTSNPTPKEAQDVDTVAYDAVTGAELWAERFASDREDGSDVPAGLAVDPGGGAVYVTGTTSGRGKRTEDVITLAYLA
jgi:outer membrane protein assembly factor BamB